MRMLQGMNLSQEKYALYCSVYSGMFAFSSYYYFSSCISWIAPGIVYFPVVAMKISPNSHALATIWPCYSPLGGGIHVPSPLTLGTSLCLSSSGVDVMLCDFQDKARKRRGSLLLALFLETLTLGIGTGCWDRVLWGHLGHVHKSCVGGSDGWAQLRSWLPVSKEYQSCEVSSLWVDIGARHHLLATSGKSVELDLATPSQLSELEEIRNNCCCLMLLHLQWFIVQDVSIGSTQIHWNKCKCFNCRKGMHFWN